MQDVLSIKIPFYDVDPMNVVWHGNYVKYFEMARCSFLEKKNMTYADMERCGYAFPVASLKVKYIRPCVFGQEIQVQLKLKECENFLVFQYKIVDKETKEKLCIGETKQMAVDLKNKKAVYEIPQIFLEQIKG